MGRYGTTMQEELGEFRISMEPDRQGQWHVRHGDWEVLFPTADLAFTYADGLADGLQAGRSQASQEVGSDSNSAADARIT